MRTTLTLDDDLGKQLERRRRVRGTTFKQEVNELLRLGLERSAESERPAAYRTPSVSAGRCLIGGIDDVAEALAAAEGERFA